MDNLDDSENNAKISDSAYSNSCSNSQSRRSRSSKSTHSGSNSSGSSGYGGKPSTSGYSSSINQLPEKRSKDKEGNKKKVLLQGLQTTEVINESECMPEPAPVFQTPQEDKTDVICTPTPGSVPAEKCTDIVEVSAVDRSSGNEEIVISNTSLVPALSCVPSRTVLNHTADGFSCVISMQDGIVMYTSASITTALGYPKEMWIGRSFIDFVHQRDRDTFASQITSGLSIPKVVKGTELKESPQGDHISVMVCRIRKYKGLLTGFGIKDRMVSFMPFLLKFFFKDMNEDNGKVVYLVIQATPFFSAFKTSHQIITNPVPFILRHSPNGRLDYVDPESVPYLGYLPQDIVEKDALQLYHPSDLLYLRQVYEIIVKDGGVLRSKPYRMMSQNGEYLKLETEWTSFVNPWSKKLEFIIGKHFILEGPANPDVFQTPELCKFTKRSLEEEAKAQAIRETIIRIMNEVLTKPAETAKQHMSKRCQDLASFMESLIENTPKPDDELRLEIQDTDHSCFERDSVMLGGISPHHDYDDSNTSIETPLSYTQLNYNENLQRYFDSHEPYSFVDDDDINKEEENKSKMLENDDSDSKFSNSMDGIGDWGNNFDSSAVIASTSYATIRLTESLINKHNTEMEKELLKIHREARPCSKGERERASNESRKKKKEHLARCNAFFQPTAAEISSDADSQHPHGVKRASKQTEDGSTHKHRCSSSIRMGRRRHNQKLNNNPPIQATFNVPSPWATTPANNMNFILGFGIPPHMSVIAPMTIPGVVPMYYAPTSTQTMPSRSDALTTSLHCTPSHYQGYPYMNNLHPHMHYHGTLNQPNLFHMNSACASNMDPNKGNINNFGSTVYQQQNINQMQCMMLGRTAYGSPFIYPTMQQQAPQIFQPTSSAPKTEIMQPILLPDRNFQEACKLTIPPKRNYENLRKMKIAEARANRGGGFTRDDKSSSTSSSYGSIDPFHDDRYKRKSQHDVSDSTNDKTDGESSYSSFYSSFFKTDSGSNEESDAKNTSNKQHKKFWNKRLSSSDAMSIQSARNFNGSPQQRKNTRRKVNPPWLQQVSVTSELIYRYQVLTKNRDEVLSSDREKLKQLEQPLLVNEQLSQLYLDLQLEGVAARLTLEEGLTTSSSSGDETTIQTTKTRRRKREYSRLVMIYEEDAPLPPPEDSSSTS